MRALLVYIDVHKSEASSSVSQKSNTFSHKERGHVFLCGVPFRFCIALVTIFLGAIANHPSFATLPVKLSTSLASPTGSSCIACLIPSRLPYLSINACLHSSVPTSLPSHTRVSAGFVTPLKDAVNVFIALDGMFIIITAKFGQTSLSSHVSSMLSRRLEF